MPENANRSLQGPPVTVVTGAARGIGAQLARRLAARGHRLALIGLEADQLAEVASECGPGAAWWEADVTDGTHLSDVAAQVAGRLGPARAVVANAGIALGAPLLHADAASYDRVIEVNLLGSVRTARAFLPHLVETRGYLLQIASLAAIVTSPMLSAYCASKSGVEAFARALAAEVAHHGVDVGVAYLSWTDTEMVRGSDRVTPLAARRSALPPPFNRTYPVDAAADRLARGLERRAAHIYLPPWIRAVALGRGLLGPGLAKATARTTARTERELLARHPEALRGAVGAGGEADVRARDRRVTG
ncbi:MAG TPA: SDR family oxidoreductase [Kineosporiaceae bacterium]